DRRGQGLVHIIQWCLVCSSSRRAIRIIYTTTAPLSHPATSLPARSTTLAYHALHSEGKTQPLHQCHQADVAREHLGLRHVGQ
ncbi:hypothetical protein PIB30_107522, partial [Stylosanthes scabra]|nr:hypothetical protein [Stylosanthes scabra]